MGRQMGILKFTGTVGGLTFYKLGGQYYVRQKTSLDRKRVMHDPCFARSRECMSRFGQASQIARQVYQKLPERKKQPGLFGRMTGKANHMLFAGESPEVVLQKLSDTYLTSLPHPQDAGVNSVEEQQQLCTSKKALPVFDYGTRETRAPAPARQLPLYSAPGAVSEDLSGFVWARIP